MMDLLDWIVLAMFLQMIFGDYIDKWLEIKKEQSSRWIKNKDWVCTQPFKLITNDNTLTNNHSERL